MQQPYIIIFPYGLYQSTQLSPKFHITVTETFSVTVVDLNLSIL